MLTLNYKISALDYPCSPTPEVLYQGKWCHLCTHSPSLLFTDFFYLGEDALNSPDPSLLKGMMLTSQYPTQECLQAFNV